MMAHDLVSLPNARISLTSIHAISNELEDGVHTGVVYVDYGTGNRVGFEGDVEAVMRIIDAYCESRLVGA